MNPAARDEYLATEVLTASPQKLQLMLLDAAIRFAQRSQSHWEQGEDAAATDALLKCQKIVSQLMVGVAPNLESPLARKIAAVYSFVYRTLVAAKMEHDTAKLAEALTVLEIERETWRQVCQQHGAARPNEVPPAPHGQFAGAPPLAPLTYSTADLPRTGLSFEA